MRRKKTLYIVITILIGIVMLLILVSLLRMKQLHISYMEKADHYHQQAQKEKEWLITTQLSNGAFAKRPENNGNALVIPYFSCVTAQALMEGDTQGEYNQQVKDYLEWQFSHLNDEKGDYNGMAGTIYNYEMVVKDGKVIQESATGEYDSTDSYAATFLSAVYGFAKQYGETEYLRAHEPELLAVSNAMLATMHQGLSYTKPDYKIKNLMDNAEVYAGCHDMSELISMMELDRVGFNQQKFKELKKNLIQTQKELRTNMNALWNEAGQYYEPAVDELGKPAFDFDWKEFYPCAAAQLFPVIFGVNEPDMKQSKAVYQQFSTTYRWEILEHYHKGDVSFYWSMIAYAGACMEDETRVNSYIESYQKETGREHKKPLYNADSAWMIRTCEYMSKLYREKQIGILQVWIKK